MPLISQPVHVNGMPCMRLLGEGGASAVVALHGAQVLSWIGADGRERLFLAKSVLGERVLGERARFAEGAAIRGGVPVIFPQFGGRGALPKHGFARTLPWHLAGVDDEHASFELTHGPATAAWPHAFIARLHVALDAQALDITLEITNPGTTGFAFTAALHTYLSITDIATATLDGLGGCDYEDSAEGGASRHQEHAVLRFSGEVDRIYVAPSQPLELHDGARVTTIQQRGFADTVVWNPGAALAAGIADLAPDEHRRFVCVEAGQVLQPVHLSPGERWSGSQRLR